MSAIDFHALRIKLAEQRAKMSPEEAERDFRETVEYMRSSKKPAKKPQPAEVPRTHAEL